MGSRRRVKGPRGLPGAAAGKIAEGIRAARDAGAIRSRPERAKRRDLIATAHDQPRLCQVDVVRTGFASDETAIQTFGLGTRHLTPHPEAC